MKYTTNCLLLIVTFLMLSCKSDNNNDQINHADSVEVGKTSYCMKYDSEHREHVKYMELTVDGENVTGRIYLPYHYAVASVYYEFEGTFIEESKIKILLQDESSTEKTKEIWFFDKNGVTVLQSSDLSRQNNHYSFIPCDQLTDLSEYISLEELEADMYGGMVENTFSTCFHMYYPTGGSQRVRVMEYIRVKFYEDGTMNGSGAGYDEGEPDWSALYEGEQLEEDGNRWIVNVTYKDENGVVNATKEEWLYENESLKVLKITPQTYRQAGTSYHIIPCDGIDEWAEKLMR